MPNDTAVNKRALTRVLREIRDLLDDIPTISDNWKTVSLHKLNRLYLSINDSKEQLKNKFDLLERKSSYWLTLINNISDAAEKKEQEDQFEKFGDDHKLHSIISEYHKALESIKEATAEIKTLMSQHPDYDQYSDVDDDSFKGIGDVFANINLKEDNTKNADEYTAIPPGLVLINQRDRPTIAHPINTIGTIAAPQHPEQQMREKNDGHHPRADKVYVRDVHIDSTLRNNITLPSISITPFSGAKNQWLQFLQLFDSLIHNSALPNIVKFIHLKNLVKGEASIVIDAIPITDVNYDFAIDTLRRTFGNKNTLCHELRSQMFNFSINDNTISGLLRSYYHFLALYNQLEVLGDTVNHKSNSQILERTFPPNIVRQVWEKHNNETPDCKTFLSTLFEILQTEATLYSMRNDIFTADEESHNNISAEVYDHMEEYSEDEEESDEDYWDDEEDEEKEEETGGDEDEYD